MTALALKDLKTSDFKFHRMSPKEVIAQLGSDLNSGLTSDEAKQRSEKYGLNELEKEEETSLWERIKEQFEDLLARILLLAATISLVIALTGDGEEGLAAYVEPFVILLILVLNALVAIYQDMDADSALDALKDMQAAECQVKRNGKWKTIEAKFLVPGDIVKVSIGSNVPADIRLTELLSCGFQVEEAPLTGESVSVHKVVDKIQEGGDILQEQINMVFASTTVNYGSAIGVVVYTGMKSAIGRV